MSNESLKGLQKQINRIRRGADTAVIKDSASWHYLETILTSTSWDGDSFSTTGKTKIDLSSEFGAPANIKAVLLRVAFRDSGSAGTECYIVLSNNDTAGSGIDISASAIDDRLKRCGVVIPCDSNGDIYYQIVASDTDSMDIWLQIWGYML